MAKLSLRLSREIPAVDAICVDRLKIFYRFSYFGTFCLWSVVSSSTASSVSFLFRDTMAGGGLGTKKVTGWLVEGDAQLVGMIGRGSLEGRSC